MTTASSIEEACQHPWLTHYEARDADEEAVSHLMCRHCLLCVLCGQYIFGEH